MRIALIADIHGNLVALDAALGEIRAGGVDQIVCLGDTLQGGPQPGETLGRLRDLQCPIVMGNSDAWLLGDEADSVEPTSTRQREVRAWTLSRLSADDLAFLASFQPTVALSVEGGKRLLCFHGSPTSLDDILLPDSPQADWERALGPNRCDVMAGGHTHIQQIRRIGDALFVNPGSIGVVYDPSLPKERLHIDAWAEFCILTLDRGRLSVDFHRTPYPVQDYIGAIRASGIVHADRLIAEYRGPSG